MPEKCPPFAPLACTGWIGAKLKRGREKYCPHRRAVYGGRRSPSAEGTRLMPIVNRIADFQPELTEWRQDLHANPELGYEEHRTSELVASRLTQFGLEVHRGLGGTGVVGTLKGLEPGGRA